MGNFPNCYLTDQRDICTLLGHTVGLKMHASFNDTTLTWDTGLQNAPKFDINLQHRPMFASANPNGENFSKSKNHPYRPNEWGFQWCNLHWFQLRYSRPKHWPKWGHQFWKSDQLSTYDVINVIHLQCWLAVVVNTVTCSNCIVPWIFHKWLMAINTPVVWSPLGILDCQGLQPEAINTLLIDQW